VTPHFTDIAADAIAAYCAEHAAALPAHLARLLPARVRR
jgi:hypothetical protein